MPIIKTYSGPSETQTKYSYQVTNELSSDKPSNILMEYLSEDAVGATRTMSTEKTSSNPRAHIRSDPDIFKQGSQ